MALVVRSIVAMSAREPFSVRLSAWRNRPRQLMVPFSKSRKLCQPNASR